MFELGGPLQGRNLSKGSQAVGDPVFALKESIVPVSKSRNTQLWGQQVALAVPLTSVLTLKPKASISSGRQYCLRGWGVGLWRLYQRVLGEWVNVEVI